MADEQSFASSTERTERTERSEPSSVLDRVLAVALRFRLLVVAAAACLLVAGGLTLRQMPDDPVGELASGPVLEVQTDALGLSSQEVEQYVTVPLENNLLDGVMGVWDVRSQSLPGVSVVDLLFEPGVTTLHARQLVEERLTNAFSLPNVSSPPQLIQPLASSDRAMMIGLSSRTVDPLELSYLARWVVKPRLEGVGGVANVVIYGQRDRQLQVLVDPARLTAARIPLSQIIQTAGNAQLVSPLTYLEGSAPGTGGFLDGPNQRLEIRPVLPLGAPRDLARVPVTGPGGHQVPLGTLAHVVVGHQPLVGDAITRSGPGLVLLVQRLPGASERGVVDGVRRALGELTPALHGVQVDTGMFAPARYAQSALSNFGLAALIATGLVLLALVALLLDAGAVAVVAATVAVSLTVAGLVLDLLGFALSAPAMLGLLLGSTVVLDDAAGSVLALGRAAGAQRLRAPSILATLAPLRMALGYATLIVLIAIVPAFVAHGPLATFVHPMLLALALSALAGLAVALTLTPALGLLVIGRAGVGRPAGAVAAARYRAVIHRLVAAPRALPLGLCLLGLLAIGVLPFLGNPAAPAFRDRDLLVSWRGPAGASLSEMDRITQRALAALRAVPGVTGASATLGRAVGGDQLAEPSEGQLYVTVAGGVELPHVREAVTRTVASVPGMAASVTNQEAAVLDGALASPAATTTIRVYGEDYATLARLARRVSNGLRGASGIGSVTISQPPAEPNIEVRVNDQAAVRAGVLPGDARRQASTLVNGLTVGNFFQDQAVFGVVVRGTLDVRRSTAAIQNLQIDTAGRGNVRLSQIARVTARTDPTDIRHQALSRYVDVTVARRGIGAGAAVAAARQAIGSVEYPIGYHAEILGSTPEDATGHVLFLSYVLAAAIGIVLLLQAALRSWRLAAIVFLTLPLALAGGVLVALASGWMSSLGTDAGLLVVFAFAVRQALLLMAALRRMQARDGGALNLEHVSAAAGERVLPMLASTALLAVALLPFLLLGDSAGGELTHVAAGVMLGGMAGTALLVLIALPLVCIAFATAEPPAVIEPLDDTLDRQAEMILTHS